MALNQMICGVDPGGLREAGGAMPISSDGPRGLMGNIIEGMGIESQTHILALHFLNRKVQVTKFNMSKSHSVAESVKEIHDLLIMEEGIFSRMSF
jgi:hypothetical protein